MIDKHEDKDLKHIHSPALIIRCMWTNQKDQLHEHKHKPG